MVKCMSVRAILILRIVKKIHNKSVGFVLTNTQADAKSEIYMEIVVYGSHLREWVIRIDKNLYGLKYSVL